MKLKKTKWLIVLLILLTACTPKSSQVCKDQDCINTEVVDTYDARMKGLMFREKLDGGMLFEFTDIDSHIFWMKNTLIPLDMIWRSEDGEILYIHKNAQPCKEDPCGTFGSKDIKSKFVLEVSGGFTDKHGWKVGDILNRK